MSEEQKFLEWLADQDRYWIPDEEVHEKFPDLEYRMIAVTKQYDEETGETKTPIRDWRKAVKYE